MLNSLYKRIVRNLIKSRILIVDPGDEVDVDNFCDWLYSDSLGSKMKKIVKKVAWGAGIIAVICIAIMFICNQIVVDNAEGKVFSDIDSIKYNKVGLLLGTTPQARFDRITNYFFIYRIQKKYVGETDQPSNTKLIIDKFMGN